MDKSRSLATLLLLSLVLFGCVGTSGSATNKGPVVELNAIMASGRVPFTPFFVYNCYDSTGAELALCEVKLDGETIAKGRQFLPTFIRPMYQKPGQHLLEISAIDKKNQSTYKNLTFTVTDTIYVRISNVSAYLENGHPDVFSDAFAYWEKSNGVKFKLVGENETVSPENEQSTIFIEWVKEGNDAANGRFYPDGAEHHNEGLFIAIGDSHCYGKWQPYTYSTVLHILEHELGHALGYSHNNDSSGLMFGGPGGVGFYRYQADVNETTTIPAGWTFPYTFCSTSRAPFNDTSRVYSFDVTAGQLMDFYVVPSQEEYAKAMANKPFTSVPGCSAQSSYSFKKTCTVTDTSLLLIRHIGGQGAPAAKVSVLIQQQ